MCPHQVGLYSPKIHNCYTARVSHGAGWIEDRYLFADSVLCGENEPWCHMVEPRAYFDCGIKNNGVDQWSYSDVYFCGNAQHRKLSGKCRDPSDCCNFEYASVGGDRYGCYNSEQEIIDGNDAAVTTLPTCPITGCNRCENGQMCCNGNGNGAIGSGAWNFTCSGCGEPPTPPPHVCTACRGDYFYGEMCCENNRFIPECCPGYSF